jgi:hypothetical protein
MLKINNNNKYFDLENRFFYETKLKRIQKLLNHYELIKLLTEVKGEIVELGVFKGVSLIKFAYFRDILKLKKKIIAFDTFKTFPQNNSKSIYDRNFPKNFSTVAGNPIKKKQLQKILNSKKIKNIKLVQGNIYKSLKYLTNNKIKISLLHLDLDTEDITYFALKVLKKNLSKNSVIVLDDYNIHSGINRAVKKFKKTSNIKFKILKPFFGHNPHYFIKK